MRRKQANPKPVKVEGDEMPGTTDSAQSQQSPSSAHGQSSNRESSDVDEYDRSMVIDTGSMPSDSPDLCEHADSPEKYSIIELHRSVEMVYYPDGNAEDGESQDAMLSSGESSCDKDLSLSGSVSNSEISNNLSSVSLADVSFQETDQTSATAAVKSKHSLSKSRKKTDRILPKTGVDGEKKYFCPVCEDAFSSEHEFTRHIRSHNSPTNVSTVNMCMICQKVLSSQSSLDRHMLVHSGERPFKCESCGQAFTTNGNMHRHMRTHKNAQANAGLPNELVPKIRKKKKQQQLMPLNAEDATSTQQLQQQVALTNSVGRSTMNRKRKIADSGQDVEIPEKRSDVVKYLLTLASSHDSAKMNSMIAQSSARIDPTKYPLQCSECHTTFFSRFHLLTDLEEHERCQRTSLSVTCVACEVKLSCVNDFGDHMLSAHCSPKEGAVLEGSENIKPAFNELMAVVPFTSERFSQMYKIVTEKPSKHQLQRTAVNYCFGCEQMSEKSYGSQTKKLGPNCSGSFCDFCRFFFYKCEQQKDNVLWQERDVILSGYSNQKMDSDKVIQDKMAKTEFLHMLDLKSLSESKAKHSKNSLQFDANQNVIKVLSSGEKPPITLKSLPLQSSILPKLSLTEGTVNHVQSSAIEEETLAPNKAPVLNLSSISAKHIVALIEGSKMLPIHGSIKIDLPRLMVGSPGIDEERILPPLEDPMNSTIKMEDDERDSSTEATDPPLSSTTGSLQFKCSQCPYSSTDRSTLVRHMRTHNGERPFKCLYCNYQFTTKANCERHIKKKHSAEHREPDANGISSFQLPTDSSSSARSHQGCHYQCKACPKNFASRANLLRHNQRQHSGLLNRSVGGHTGVQSGESLICNGLALLANEAENCSRQLSSNSDENVPLQLTSSKGAVEVRHQPQSTSSSSTSYRGYAENAEDSDEPLDFSLKSQRTSGQNDCVGHSLECNEPIDLTVRGQGQQRRVPRECENSRSGRRLTVPHVALKLPAPGKGGSAGEKAWIKRQLLPSASSTKALMSDLRSVVGHFCCSVCQSVFKHKVELSVHMRSHNIEMDSQLHGEAIPITLDVKPDSQVKTAHPQFTVVASSTFFSSSSPLNKKLDFDKSPILPKEPNNNVASSLNANFVNEPLETKPLNLLKGDLASVNQILESTSGRQLQPLLAMTSSTASPSLSPSTSIHGLPDLAVSTNVDHGFVDAISKSIAQNIILKNKGAIGKREAEVMDDDEQGSESRTIKKKRNSYADSPRKLLCEFCTRAFPWISSLKRHILTHTGQKPYRCKQCGTTFSTKSNRERHMIRKHGLDVHDPTTRQTMDRPYKCHLCVFSSFTTSGKLMRHYKVKHPDKEVPETLLMSTGSLDLDDSDMMSRSGTELLTADERAEMMSSDEDENEDPTDDEVNELTYQMMAKSRLMQTLNQTEPTSSCSLMTPVNGGVSHLFMVATKDNADGGLAAKHINPERDNYNVDKITDCWKCKRTFNDRKTLLRHLKEHNIDLPFKCYLCDASFEDRLMSLEHKHDEHPSDWATVQEKNKVTNLKDYSEFMEAVVKDTLDGKVTRRTHEGVELDIKPEPDYAQRKVFCTLCPKRFWSLQDLRRHMRSHTGDRPFECDICLSRFTLKHSMVRHRRKHMTEGLGASGEAQCSASDEDSVHMSTTPVEEGCAQSSPKMCTDSSDESARVSLSLGQILPCVTTAASTHVSVGGESGTKLSDQSDLLQTLLDIDDKSKIDRMLESPTNAANMLGIRRPKSE